MTTYTVGVDLGQASDFTAITVVRQVPPPRPAPGELAAKPTLEIVWLERFRQVTYPVVAEKIAGMAAWPALAGATFGIDAGGPGRPVIDLIREQVRGVHAITTTSGLVTNNPTPLDHNVPKPELITALDVLLQTGRLRIDERLKHAKLLVQELSAFGYTISDTGRTRMEAADGHDDMVMSLALACWLAGRSAGPGGGFLQWMKNKHVDRERRQTPPGPPAEGGTR